MHTIENTTGGIITIEKLQAAEYVVDVDAHDTAEEVILAGSGEADVYVGEIAYLRIELDYIFGYLDVEVTFPGLDRLCELEISGVALDPTVPITVVNSPGIIIERALGGAYTYIPGPASVRTFSVVTGGTIAVTLAWWQQPFGITTRTRRSPWTLPASSA